MRIDPVTLQIFANHAQAAADSMAYTLFRTAHSTFVFNAKAIWMLTSTTASRMLESHSVKLSITP